MTLRAISVAVLALLAAPAAARADEIIVSRPGGLTGAELARAGVTAEENLPLPGIELVNADGSTDAALRALRADPDVEWAERNQRVHARASATAPPLWGLSALRASAAWEVTQGAGVTVAVVDGGVRRGHVDLDAQLVPGWDYVEDDADPDDEAIHGTHVTGTIVAERNGNGIDGVAPEARVLPLRVLDETDAGDEDDVVKAFHHAGELGIRVVNASFGHDAPLAAMRAAMRAYPRTLFVVPAGNFGVDVDGGSPEYPCVYDDPNVLCVGASTSFDRAASGSNYGDTSVDLFAPGLGIWSTVPGGYDPLSGTSMAAAQASGVAALVAAEHPSWSAASIKEALLDGAERLPALDGKSVTGARLDAAGALDAAAEMPDPEPEPEPPAPTPTPSPTPTPTPLPTPAPPAASPAPPATTAPAPPVAAAPAARVSGLRISGTSTRRLSFSLSSAATVTIRLERRRCSRGRCSWRRASTRRHSGRTGTQRVTVGRKLAPGVWRVSVAAPANASRRAFRVRVR